MRDDSELSGFTDDRTEPDPVPGPLEARFLVLAPTGRDAALTCTLLERARLEGVAFTSMDQLCTEIRRGAAGLILTDEVMTPGNAATLAALIGQQEAWSDLPVLLFTGGDSADRHPTLQQLAPLGNVTLLERPVRPVTMLSAARSALRARRRQYASRRELDRQRAAVRQRDEFLAMLGHELRNPLGNITLAAELLTRRGLGEPQVSLIRRQARHLAHLVDDLLDVSRITSGKLVLQRQTVALDELLRRCVETTRISAETRGLDLAIETEPASVHGDPVRLEQVFGNLLTNAIKYTPSGGWVRVALATDGDEVRVSIEDSGVGIGPEMLDRVFEPFVQVRHTIERSDGGLGIGLTLVRALVELHDGTVSVTSDGVGHGSRFCVTLPDAGVRATTVSRRSGTSDNAPLRVLIVEDNPDSRELLQLLVEALGHSVEVTGDGCSGLERALDTVPDVMLVDIGLPGLDGYGVARGVRAALGSGPRMIAVSGYGQPEDRERAREAGFDLHCTKPLDPANLAELLRRTPTPDPSTPKLPETTAFRLRT